MTVAMVGNNGDGTINTFDSQTDAFTGTLTDIGDKPILEGDLRPLAPGIGGFRRDPNTPFFAADLQGDVYGLFRGPATNPPIGATFVARRNTNMSAESGADAFQFVRGTESGEDSVSGFGHRNIIIIEEFRRIDAIQRSQILSGRNTPITLAHDTTGTLGGIFHLGSGSFA